MADREIIDDLMTLLKEKFPDEYEHSMRVLHLVKQLCEVLGLTDDEETTICIAAELHDIGNLSISEDIVIKNSRLDFDEYAEIQRHTELAKSYIEKMDCFKVIYPIIYHHHENMNGFGYPDGLEGDEIPLGARVIHVAEAFDSMTSVRKNRKNALTKEQAFAEIQEYENRIYDLQIVKQLPQPQN